MAIKGIYELTGLWDAGATVFTSIKMEITDTAYAAGSRMIDITTLVGGQYFRVDADGNLDISGYMDIKPLASVPWKEGRIGYDSVRKGFVVYNAESDITGNVMEEEWAPVWNDTGVQIDDGTPVYVTGTSSGLPTIAPAIADGQRVIGLATHDIGNAERGYVTRSGNLSGPDYSAFSDGDTVYLSTTVAGDVVNVEPSWPNKVIELGIIVDASNPGSINIDIEHSGGPVTVIKSYTFASRTAASGEYFQAGFYDYNVADANLTQASTTQVHGIANVPYAAHAFIVSGGSGATDGSDLVLTVTGTSITDAGVRTAADSEVVCADCLPSGAALDSYFETSKKWLGQITYTLSSTAGTAFAFDFNFGTCKYEDFNNINTTLRGIESVGLCNVSDTGFNIEVMHHNSTGWTYSAAAFQAGNTPLADMSSIHGLENDLTAGEQFAFKIANLSTAIAGAASEGLLIRVTTGANQSISYMDSHFVVTGP